MKNSQSEKKKQKVREKLLLTISKVNFEAKERNIAKTIQERKNKKRVREKTPFDNFLCV